MFWHMTPRMFTPYVKAYKIKQDSIDDNMWRMGMYVTSAVGSSIANALSKKSKAKYLEKPIRYLNENEYTEEGYSNGMTEAEKKRATENLFLKLNIMASNYNLIKEKEKAEDCDE